MRVRWRDSWSQYSLRAKTAVYMNSNMFILLHTAIVLKGEWTTQTQTGRIHLIVRQWRENRRGSTLSLSQKRKRQKKKRRMGMKEEVWWSSGGVYLEGLPELISQSADLREDVTNEKGLWHTAAPQRDQALHQLLCSRELRFGKQHFTNGDSLTLSVY